MTMKVRSDKNIDALKVSLMHSFALNGLPPPRSWTTKAGKIKIYKTLTHWRQSASNEKEDAEYKASCKARESSIKLMMVMIRLTMVVVVVMMMMMMMTMVVVVMAICYFIVYYI